MFRPVELSDYFDQNKLCDEARKLIGESRERQPEVKVPRDLGAVSVMGVFSRKMGERHIAVTGRSLRGSAATWYEFNDRVHEYHANAHTVTISTRREDGRVVSTDQHTFDFLVLADTPRFEDWREEKDLVAIEVKDSARAVRTGRFFRDEENVWHDREAEAYCASVGLAHVLRTNGHIPRQFVENARYLCDYHDGRTPLIASDTQDKLRSLVREGPVRFEGLLNHEGIDADTVLSAIVQKVLYVDLVRDSLRDTANLWVHLDAVAWETDRLIREASGYQEPLPLPGMGCCQPGTKVSYGNEEWQIELVAGLKADAQVLLVSDNRGSLSLSRSQVEELLRKQADETASRGLLELSKRRTLSDLSKKERACAIRKYTAVQEGHGLARSTLARAKRVVAHQASAIDALIALAPRNGDKGRRGPRLSAALEALAKEIIETKYNTPEAPSKARAYDIFLPLCEERLPGEYMSYATFCKRAEDQESLRKRYGKRVEYRDSDIPLILDARESLHGILPHEVLYIDHTIPNLVTRGPQGQDWKKTWLSLGVDGNVTCPRAMYLSYHAPSAMSVLMVLRDYVRRWRRMPRVVVVDGGADLRAGVVKEFCEIFGTGYIHRTTGRPRGGAPVERIIGVSEEEFFNGLEGCSIQLKQARTVTKSMQPNLRRAWSFPELYQALDKYLFDFRYRVHVHPKLGMTAEAFENVRYEQTGLRSHVTVDFDENLLLLTSPTPPHEFHTIHPGRGVWESNHFYWHSEFSRFGGAKCPVRVEPWMDNVIYVYVDKHWVTAIARNLMPCWNRTRYEVAQAKRQERSFNRLAAARDGRTVARARRLQEIRTRPVFDETIALQQATATAVYQALGMTLARPLPEELRRDLPTPALPSVTADTELEATSASLAIDEPDVSAPLSESRHGPMDWAAYDERTGLI